MLKMILTSLRMPSKYVKYPQLHFFKKMRTELITRILYEIYICIDPSRSWTTLYKTSVECLLCDVLTVVYLITACTL